jgi:hypothetical protein
MKTLKVAIAMLAGVAGLVGLPKLAEAANGVALQYVYGGSGGTVVFIHGKGNCGYGAGGGCGGNPNAYWTNGSNGATILNEATTKWSTGGTTYLEAFAIGHDTENQGYWTSANDVANCLRDLMAGTNSSGCNPSLYRRSRFHLVAHSAGAAIVDRIVSSGWYPDITAAIDGGIISDQGALAGARSASALYNVDGQGNWVTGFVSWLSGTLGMELKSNGAWSLTRGNVNNEAALGRQGHSPKWFYKITTSGGGCSANNNGSWEFCGTGVDEHDNDLKMGAACASVGYSSDDDSDGILWNYDTDPTSNTGNGGGKYNYRYTGAYWHWISSWANHSHGRNDAYTTKGDWMTSSGCYTRSPGTCIAMYGL